VSHRTTTSFDMGQRVPNPTADEVIWLITQFVVHVTCRRHLLETAKRTLDYDEIPACTKLPSSRA